MIDDWIEEHYLNTFSKKIYKEIKKTNQFIIYEKKMLGNRTMER